MLTMTPMAPLRARLTHTPLLVRTFAVYGLIALVVTLSGWLLKNQPLTQPVAVETYVAPVVHGEARRVLSGSPAKIEVERLDISLPVEKGVYNALTKEWSLSHTAAFFATVSDTPNDHRGSTFIYGHNHQSVFARLADIRPGDEVKVTTANGYAFTYEYSRDAIIRPDMTDVLYEDPETPQLVLMTCEGLFSEARRIMYFQLVEVSE
jgi:LPXTG-site transpeptidase (sortase) family protein